MIPAFDEEARIRPSLERILEFLDRRPGPIEILVVDDGSSDGTSGVAASFGEPVRVIRNEVNQGKGYSVRRGFLEARGDWVLFTDADLSTPIGELDALLAAGAAGADVVIGSRALDRSRILVHQSRSRELGGILFNRIVRLTLGLPIHDTQCGFKLFRRSASQRIFEVGRIPGFGFDPELLYLARRWGLVVREVPVTWSNDEATKVRFARDAVTMFFNLAEIRWNWIAGKYRHRP